jgi:AAA domain
MVSSKFNRVCHLNNVIRHEPWHEHLYRKFSENIVIPNRFLESGAPGLMNTLQGSEVILCTLSMISDPVLQKIGFTQLVPITNVIIDEANQIEVGQYVPLFKTFGKTLRKICFVGDDKQCKSLLYRLTTRNSSFCSAA